MRYLLEARDQINAEITWADTHQSEEAVAGLIAALNIVEDLIVEAGLADPANAAILADAGHAA